MGTCNEFEGHGDAILIVRHDGGDVLNDSTGLDSGASFLVLPVVVVDVRSREPTVVTKSSNL